MTSYEAYIHIGIPGTFGNMFQTTSGVDLKESAGIMSSQLIFSISSEDQAEFQKLLDRHGKSDFLPFEIQSKVSASLKFTGIAMTHDIQMDPDGSIILPLV